MRFDFDLVSASFIARPNRFLVVAELDATRDTVRAHCADPGRMRELLIPGTTVYLSHSPSRRRKTDYDLRLVGHPDNGQLVSVNSGLANRLFAEGMADGQIAAFEDFRISRAEAVTPHISARHKGVRSRFDFLLEDFAGSPLWVEVKSVTLVEDRVALFPDAVTERGRRHVLELAELRKELGVRVAIVFVVQRSDADVVSPCRTTDPAFADALASAADAGVELYGYACHVSMEEVRIERRIAVALSASDGEALSGVVGDL